MPKLGTSLMFLCSNCRTEQPVDKIIYEGHKECYCPNCKQRCCDDYCMVMANGRWNPIDYPVPHDAEIETRYNAAAEAFTRAQHIYDQAKSALEAAERDRDKLHNEAQQSYERACKAYREAYEQTKQEYEIA